MRRRTATSVAGLRLSNKHELRRNTWPITANRASLNLRFTPRHRLELLPRKHRRLVGVVRRVRTRAFTICQYRIRVRPIRTEFDGQDPPIAAWGRAPAVRFGLEPQDEQAAHVPAAAAERDLARAQPRTM